MDYEDEHSCPLRDAKQIFSDLGGGSVMCHWCQKSPEEMFFSFFILKPYKLCGFFPQMHRVD